MISDLSAKIARQRRKILFVQNRVVKTFLPSYGLGGLAIEESAGFPFDGDWHLTTRNGEKLARVYLKKTGDYKWDIKVDVLVDVEGKT